MSIATDFDVRSSTPADRPELRALLAAAGLPVDDLDRAATLRFWVAESGGSIAGAVGLEQSGTTALLRSLVVAPPFRRHGVGQLLVAALECHARELGVDELVLLTQTAESFFLRLGYRTVQRSAIAAGIRALEEFRSLCPESAVCLAKPLRRHAREAGHG